MAQPTAPEAGGPIIVYLRRTPGARGALYLVTAVAVFETVGRLQNREHPQALVIFHLTLLPLTLLVTRIFAGLRPEDRAHWERVDLRRGARELLGRAGLGAAALLTMLGVAATKGWVRAPQWGWAQQAAGPVLNTAGLSLIGHLAVAWNEETVFRGYLQDTLDAAMPPALAGALLTLFFGAAHGLKPQTLAGEAALGLALLALRRSSGGLWASVGYHWAWNAMQTAVLGPADGPPSLRPLEANGPPLWLGRPGHPEPGLLMLLVNLAVAALVQGKRQKVKGTSG